MAYKKCYECDICGQRISDMEWSGKYIKGFPEIGKASGEIIDGLMASAHPISLKIGSGKKWQTIDICAKCVSNIQYLILNARQMVRDICDLKIYKDDQTSSGSQGEIDQH